MRSSIRVLAAAIVLVGGAGVAAATTTSTAATVKACEDRSGQLAIATHGHCAKDDKAVKLSTEGPQGPQGPQGVPGIQGAPGSPAAPASPGGQSSYMDVTSGVADRTIHVTGTPFTLSSQCDVTGTNASNATVTVSGPDPSYAEGSANANFDGGSAFFDVSDTLEEGANVIATNVHGNGSLLVTAGSDVGEVSASLLLSTGRAITSTQVMVISEQDECLVEVAAIPLTDVGTGS